MLTNEIIEKMKDLPDEMARLLRKLEKNSTTYFDRERGWYSLELENNILMAKKRCLAKRLDNLNSLIIVNLGFVKNNTLQSPEPI